MESGRPPKAWHYSAGRPAVDDAVEDRAAKGPAAEHGSLPVDDRWNVVAMSHETARIEACARGGRTLASKSLVERLARTDAHVLDMDLDHVSYVPLRDLLPATDTARREAPDLSVCDLTPA